MIVILLFLGCILLVSAIRNTQGALATALETDIPGYLKWAVAILAIGAIGSVPALRPLSRGLLALVIVVIFVTRYQAIFASLTGAAAPVAPAKAVVVPAAQYAAEAAGARTTNGTLTGALGGFDPNAAFDANNLADEFIAASGFF